MATRSSALAPAGLSGLLSVLLSGILGVVACIEAPLQGDEYRPEGRLPAGTPSERDAATCDGGPCGVTDADAPATRDGSVAPSNTCSSARSFGTTVGDGPGTAATASGTCSEWLSVRVTENDGSASGVPMKARITLQPTGGDFDLYVHFDAVRDLLACTTPAKSSLGQGGLVEPISLEWGEGTVPNGGDDSRTLSISIVRTGGPCGGDVGWSLTVEGNR